MASEERVEAYVLYIKEEAKILSLRSFMDDGGARLGDLLARLDPGGAGAILPKVHPAEMPAPCLETLGFRPAGAHLLYAASAGSA